MREELRKLRNFLKKQGLRLSREKIVLIDEYYKMILEWSERISLISHNGIEHFFKFHIPDSIIPTRYLNTSSIVADIGSGNGLPGIPVAIIRDDLKVYLIESKRKRAEFLRIVIKNLGLTNTKVIEKRAQEVSYLFDYLCFRQVAPIEKLLKLRNLLTSKGKMLFFNIFSEENVEKLNRLKTKYKLNIDRKLINIGYVKRMYVFIDK